MFPTKCLMPDIHKECPKLLPMLMAHYLVNAEENKELALLRRLLVFWVDKAIRKYSEAREALLAQIEEDKRPTEEKIKTGQFIYIFGFGDDIEDCLIVTRRLLRLLDRLKNMPEAKVNRELRRFIETQSKVFIEIRNFIEHAVESLSSLPPNSSLVARLLPDENGMQIGSTEVLFADLATTLRNFHKIGRNIVNSKI